MKLTAEQSVALDRIWHWMRSTEPQCLLMGGYAGTGKTTLLQHFINGLDDAPLCCAPTGKAASVLQKKLNNAKVCTIHQALYKPIPPSLERLEELQELALKHPDNPEIRQAIEDEKRRLSGQDRVFTANSGKIYPGQLVIVDESSMVTSRMKRDFIATGARVLFVGDPGQLPPVNDDGWFVNSDHDVMLTQVQRQAMDSPIVRLSMEVRNGRIPDRFCHDNCKRISKSELPGEDWLTFDQVLTGKNETRRKINRYFRKQLGYESLWPVENEKVICLKNETEGNNFYTNGVQGVIMSNTIINDFGELQCDKLFYEQDVKNNVPMYAYPFDAHYNNKAVEDPWPARNGLREFDYAYAITVHKSQGSEWNRVLLADDGMMANQGDFRKRWLYTAVTRAKEELVWVS